MSNGDPIGSEKPRGKSNAKRMGRYDGSYTPTEQRMKDKLMQQFRRTGEGPGAPSDAYRKAPCWCECGRLKADDSHLCAKCLKAALEDAAARPKGLAAWLAEQPPGQFYVWNKERTGFVPEGHPDAE